MTPKQCEAAARRCEAQGDPEGAVAFRRMAAGATKETGRGGVEAHFKARVAEVGGTTRKVQWAGRRGAPDDLALLPAVVLPSGCTWREASTTFVELKRPRGGKLSAHQEAEHALLRAHGAHVEVLWAKEAVDDWLRGLGYRLK